jgi:DNA-binding LacI/PurR family transcriptional regulator
MSDGSLDRIAWRPMYQEVRDRLVKHIEDNDLWGSQLISERELAEIFGVSRGTVRKGVEMLEREGVVSSRVGRRARVLPRQDRVEQTGLTIAVAAFGQEPAGSYGACIVAGMAGAAADIGSAISFPDLREAEARKQFFERIAEGSVQGAVLLSVVDRATVCQVLDTTSVPVILADHYFADLPLTAVIDDSEGGARQAMRHLISLGHRRIGYIEVVRREWNPWRYEGYAGALEDAGIDVDEELIEPAVQFDGALIATSKLLALPDPPTAIFAFDDVRAWGAWSAAEARGLEVGRDFAVVGYGDTGSEGGPPADLTSVSFSVQDIGRAAVEELGRLIRRETQPGKLIKIPTELKVRKSSAEARLTPAR